MLLKNACRSGAWSGLLRLPNWEEDMDLCIETWAPYGCDFKPITTYSLFGEALGDIAKMAMMQESELLYMRSDDAYPVGALAPENLMRPGAASEYHFGFTMVFSYSEAMEIVLQGLEGSGELFGAGVAFCGIWKSSLLLDECKVLAVASLNPMFDQEKFLFSLRDALSSRGKSGREIPYFAEKFGLRRFSIPYETDDVIELQIASLLAKLEFDETRRAIGGVGDLPGSPLEEF
ncbi:MAG: hypothetical protein LBL05_08610 [Synergistaceae bacterium]|nr:hypothetical protein [Synergistaceae bacterium]